MFAVIGFSAPLHISKIETDIHPRLDPLDGHARLHARTRAGPGLAPVCNPPCREGKTRSVCLGGDKKVEAEGGAGEGEALRGQAGGQHQGCQEPRACTRRSPWPTYAYFQLRI